MPVIGGGVKREGSGRHPHPSFRRFGPSEFLQVACARGDTNASYSSRKYLPSVRALAARLRVPQPLDRRSCGGSADGGRGSISTALPRCAMRVSRAAHVSCHRGLSAHGHACPHDLPIYGYPGVSPWNCRCDPSRALPQLPRRCRHTASTTAMSQRVSNSSSVARRTSTA